MTQSTVETAFIVGQNDTEPIVQVAESWGLATRTFPSGRAVLEADVVHSNGCLITELLLSDMTGIELLEELKRRDSILPVVVLAENANVSSAVKIMQLGATAVLEKPCSEHALSTTIRNATQLHRQHRDAQLKAIQMRERLATLNSNETLLADLIIEGEPNKAIARRMDVSLRTVENRRSSLYSKMGVTSVAKLVEGIMHAKLIS